MDIVVFLTLVFATWRIAHLLAEENGPAEIFATLRYWLGVRYTPEPPYTKYGRNMFSKAIICKWCSSVWIGLFWTILYTIWPPLWFIALPFALSAGAIMVDEVLAMKDTNGKS